MRMNVGQGQTGLFKICSGYFGCLGGSTTCFPGKVEAARPWLAGFRLSAHQALKMPGKPPSHISQA